LGAVGWCSDSEVADRQAVVGAEDDLDLVAGPQLAGLEDLEHRADSSRAREAAMETLDPQAEREILTRRPRQPNLQQHVPDPPPLPDLRVPDR
jgi:hypothetical protein